MALSQQDIVVYVLFYGQYKQVMRYVYTSKFKYRVMKE
jgi:hypothetical protein